jgi:hypothetical protein
VNQRTWNSPVKGSEMHESVRTPGSFDLSPAIQVPQYVRLGTLGGAALAASRQ